MGHGTWESKWRDAFLKIDLLHGGPPPPPLPHQVPHGPVLVNLVYFCRLFSEHNKMAVLWLCHWYQSLLAGSPCRSGLGPNSIERPRGPDDPPPPGIPQGVACQAIPWVPSSQGVYSKQRTFADWCLTMYPCQTYFEYWTWPGYEV